MSEPAPTFNSRRDRLVWLIGQYKWPLTAFVGMLVVIFAWIRPELPVPGWAGSFAVSWGLLAFPAWIFVWHMVQQLDGDPEMVKVGIIDPGAVPEDPEAPVTTGVVSAGIAVDETVWDDATVTAYPPIDVDDTDLNIPDAEKAKFDYLVTRADWYPEVEELEVRGAERSVLPPDEALRSAQRTKEVHDHHHKLRRQFSELQADVSRRVTRAFDAGVMLMVSELEKAELTDDARSLAQSDDTDLIKDLEDPPSPDIDQSTVEELGQVGSVTDGQPQPAATDGGRDQ